MKSTKVDNIVRTKMCIKELQAALKCLSSSEFLHTDPFLKSFARFGEAEFIQTLVAESNEVSAARKAAIHTEKVEASSSLNYIERETKNCESGDEDEGEELR